ncbi:Peptidase C14, caspase catalytic [Corchorus olitorius]|uniref:Peptidase C14, caspase catalytic n=1 Tax=Corchorus olitorius TaxID=93759 RepID=A0A1R3G2M5_9ROSI|nr:Peptidase C14, caspase catalytic [Corchorus olitorius]
MLKIVKCSRCDAPTLQLRTRDAKASRCTMCKAVTFVTEVFRSSSSTSPHRALPPPQVHSSKRAVLCGVSYKNSSYELDGCVHDAKLMRAFLISEFKFPESSIVLLSGNNFFFLYLLVNPYSSRIVPLWDRRPTKYNMRTALRWLVLGSEAGDSLVFYFSGHGSQQKNYNIGEEKDGYDETLCPSDFETEGPIVDDEINWTISRNIKASTGVMTACFIQAILNGDGTTYGSLLKAIRSMVTRMLPPKVEDKDEEEGCCAILCFLASLLTGDQNLFINNNNGSRQEPQLTASEPFDVENRLFYL